MEAATLTSPLLGGSLQQEQIALEEQSVQEGIIRYRKLRDDAVGRGEGAQLKPAQRLIVYWTEAVEEMFRREQRECLKGRPGTGRRHFGDLILRIDARTASCLSLQVAMSNLMQQPNGMKFSMLAYRIGQAIVAEIASNDMVDADREMWKVVNGLKGTDEYEKARQSALDKSYSAFKRRNRRVTPERIAWWAKKVLDEDIPGRKARMALGSVVLWFLLLECNFDGSEGKIRGLKHEIRYQKGKSVGYITLTKQSLEIIKDGDIRRQFLRPRYLPMIVPPCASTPDRPGGYFKLKTPMIIKQQPVHRRALAESDLTEVLTRRNSIDATAFRIYRPIYDIVDRLYKDGGGVVGIPQRADVPVPDKLPDDDDEAAIKLNKADRRDAWNMNKRILPSLRATHIMRMDVANMFLNREAIYFPHCLDYRGRVYPHPQPLNHQGPDVCRGLLEFAHPSPPDDRGRWWLDVHTANCFGEDKLSFEERRQWTHDHMQKILRSASKPLDDDWWHAADDPFQFLSACMAYIDDDHAARMCAHIDGKCNGLQHYAALGRDSLGAEMVSLVDMDRPSGIYDKIAAIVEPKVREDAANGVRAAKIVKDLIGKPVVKRTVMTKVYGVTLYGARSHTSETLQDLGVPRNELGSASGYLAGVVLESIGEVCKSADEIMAWLQECSRAIVEQTDQAVRWTTPLGWPVVQAYFNDQEQKIKTIVQYVTMRLIDEDCGVKKSKQISGIAANFIHSIDATHMLNVAHACRKLSIPFAGVHDSFWSRLQDMDTLSRVARDEFVKLHERPILKNLHNEWLDRYQIELPEPPSPGDFDLGRIREARYAFS